MSGKTRVSFISPALCMICGINACPDDLAVCDICLHKLQTLLTEKCRTCGRTASKCECPKPQNLKFLFFYGSAVSKRIIYLLKSSADRRDTDRLISLLITSSGLKANRYDAVTFVPRRPRAVRRYGYDQAKLIAASLAKALGLPLVTALTRSGKREQKLLSAAARRKNILNLYAAKTDIAEELKHKRYLLVDDVSTTGATLEACAKILRDSGIATQITAITIANTDLKNGG